MTWRRALFGAAVAFTVIAVFPFVRGDMERHALDDAARAGLEGKTFVRLSDGVTHYRWDGPEDGPPAVLVHGFTSPLFIWDQTAPALAEAGFRVLRYDLYGRGYSDRPAVRYDADLFDRQLLELLDALGLDGPVDLVGLSMGGAITVHFVGRHPERVRRFALIAPAGFLIEDIPLAYRLIALPGIGEWLLKAFGDRAMLAGLSRQITDNPALAAEFQERYFEQMRFKGYKRALLSTLRHNPLLDLEAEYRRAGATGKPALLVWGDADHVVPYAHHERVQETVPQVHFVGVPGGSHILNYETPDAVNPALLEFLRGEDAAK